MIDESIHLHRINAASKAIIIWASISAIIILLFGAADVISGPAVSLTIFETAAFIISAFYTKKGKYFLFWFILILFIVDTIIVINIGSFTPVSFLIRFGVGIIIIIGLVSSLKIPSKINSNSDSKSFSEQSSSNTNNGDKEKDDEIEYDINSEEYFYNILKLNMNSSLDDIKKAYKEEISKYHPDKVEHLGDEFRIIAEKKSKEINIAYRYFRVKYNF